jgi:hypothetical protein
MSATEFLQVPPAAIMVVLLMLWPAIWAGAELILALAGDVIRQRKREEPPGV